MSAFLCEHVPNSCSILRGIGRRPKHSSPAQVGPTRETTSSHLLSIDSRIPSPSRWSTILFHVQLVFILRGPLNPLRERTNHEAKNTPNLTIHFQTKNPSIAIIILNLLLFAPIVSQQSVNPFESLTLRFWYIGRTKSGKIRSGSPLEIPPDRL